MLGRQAIQRRQNTKMSNQLDNTTNMIDYVRSICEMLTDSNLTATAIAGEIGTVTSTEMGTIYINPTHPKVDSARIVPESDGQVPSYAEIGLVDSIAVDDLVAAFGDYGTPPAMPGRPMQMAFKVDTGAANSTTMVFASSADEGASTFMIRRDIRL